MSNRTSTKDVEQVQQQVRGFDEDWSSYFDRRDEAAAEDVKKS